MLARLLRPLGDWFDRRTRLMPAMMARLGIDLEGGQTSDAGLALREAGQSCVLCGSIDRCERWLEEGEDAPRDAARDATGDAPRDDKAYRAFCPNAGLLDRLPRRRERR